MHISIYIYLPSPPLTRPSILYCYGWVLLSLCLYPPELCSVKFVLSIYFFLCSFKSNIYILRPLRRRLTLTRSVSTCRWTRRNTRRLTGYLKKIFEPIKKINHCIFKTGPATSTLQGRSSTRARLSAMPTLRSSSSASMRLKVNFFLACIESSPYILVDAHLKLFFLFPCSGSTGGTGFAAIKITALGRPEILVSINNIFYIDNR